MNHLKCITQIRDSTFSIHSHGHIPFLKSKRDEALANVYQTFERLVESVRAANEATAVSIAENDPNQFSQTKLVTCLFWYLQHFTISSLLSHSDIPKVDMTLTEICFRPSNLQRKPPISQSSWKWCPALCHMFLKSFCLYRETCFGPVRKIERKRNKWHFASSLILQMKRFMKWTYFFMLTTPMAMFVPEAFGRQSKQLVGLAGWCAGSNKTCRCLSLRRSVTSFKVTGWMQSFAWIDALWNHRWYFHLKILK